eukprot:Nk52_evm90s62 gene=Nk52_evmTU90s62
MKQKSRTRDGEERGHSEAWVVVESEEEDRQMENCPNTENDAEKGGVGKATSQTPLTSLSSAVTISELLIFFGFNFVLAALLIASNGNYDTSTHAITELWSQTNCQWDPTDDLFKFSTSVEEHGSVLVCEGRMNVYNGDDQIPVRLRGYSPKGKEYAQVETVLLPGAVTSIGFFDRPSRTRFSHWEVVRIVDGHVAFSAGTGSAMMIEPVPSYNSLSWEFLGCQFEWPSGEQPTYIKCVPETRKMSFFLVNSISSNKKYEQIEIRYKGGKRLGQFKVDEGRTKYNVAFEGKENSHHRLGCYGINEDKGVREWINCWRYVNLLVNEGGSFHVKGGNWGSFFGSLY